MIKDVKNFVSVSLDGYAKYDISGDYQTIRDFRNDTGLFHVDEETTVKINGLEIEECATMGFEDKGILERFVSELKANFDFTETDSFPAGKRFVLVEDAVTYRISVWLDF